MKRAKTKSWLAGLLTVIMLIGMAPSFALADWAPQDSARQSGVKITASASPLKITELEGGFNEVSGGFAITTVINGHTWALEGGSALRLYPYRPGDIRQMWYIDGNGCLQRLVAALYEKGEVYSDPYLRFSHVKNGSTEDDSLYFGKNPYSVATDTRYEGYVPLTLKGKYLAVNDYAGKLSAIPLTVNDHVFVTVNANDLKYEASNYKNEWDMRLNAAYVFEPPQQDEELEFTRVEATARYRSFIEYELKKDDWTITYNEDGTYNVQVSGSLNVPLRQGDVTHVSLWCDNIQYAETEIKEGERNFTFQARGLPDDLEAHFWFAIQQSFFGKAGGTHWQHGRPSLYQSRERTATWELHEESISFPAQKVWTDGNEKHSGDTVKLNLRENDHATSYNVTLDEQNEWQGAFKHVPYVRWTYPYIEPKPEPKSIGDTPARASGTPANGREGLEIWLDPRGIYTVVETSNTPGYITSYEFIEPDGDGKPEWLQPGSSPALQVVFVAADGSTKAFDTNSGFAAYVQGAPTQRLLLNGDHTLIAKMEMNDQCAQYTTLNYEKANEEGKYYIYQEDPYAGKAYFRSDDPWTTDKSLATTVTFRDFQTGATLNKVPAKSFKPVVKILQVYADGKPTGDVVDIQNDFAKYDPSSPYQKLIICCCDGQLVAFSEVTPMNLFLLEPCEGASAEYLLVLPTGYGADAEYAYLGREGDKRVTVREKEKALHVALLNTSPSIGYFSVTNTPVASLEVSKTVSGAGADPTQPFTFTITLDDKTVSGTYGDMKFTAGTATFTLKHGEHKTAKNLPVVGYTVTETNNDGYTVTVNGEAVKNGEVTGTLIGPEKVTLAFNNENPAPPKSAVPKTGDSSNMSLWFGLMAVSAAGMMAMCRTKRKKIG